MAALNQKPPVSIAALRDAVGVPAGKKMSIKNLARVKRGRKAPKPAAARDSDSDYA